MKLKITITLFALTSASFAGIALGDDDGGFFSKLWNKNAKPGIAMVDNKAYREECGSCHMAYQPGLLPPQSWKKLMTGLEDHFGENAELADPERTEILNYLLDNAAGHNPYYLSKKITRGIDSVPLRISELPYFRHEHSEIPRRMIVNNPKIRSLSNCDACHTQADKGSYNEHQVFIPGYGRYDDD